MIVENTYRTDKRKGWSMFVGMLQYKQAVLGGEVLKVPPHYTSQTCLCCNHISKENRKTQSEFVCVECGFSENADIVGAKLAQKTY